MVIGLLICEVLEEEMAHLLARDAEIGRITFIQSDPGTDLIADLRSKIGSRLRVIENAADFEPDPEIDLEILALVLRVGLHMDKELLKAGVVEYGAQLAEKSDVLLLGYGLCGHALLNIEDKMTDIQCPIVMPENEDGSRVDDCVCLILGGTEKYLEHVYQEAGTWFVTPGWLKHWETLLVKELHARDVAQVKWIFDRTGYKRILRVDTGLEDIEVYHAEAKRFADMFGFYVDTARGTLSMLEAAFAKAKDMSTGKKLATSQ